MTRIILEAGAVYVPRASRRAVRVQVWGGGGGGGGGDHDATQCWGGGSGGGRAYVEQRLSFFKGVPVPFHVGAGGAAGGGGNPGRAGGTSWLGQRRELVAPGGQGGPALSSDLLVVGGRGGPVLGAKGHFKAAGGDGGVSGAYFYSSEGSGGGGAGSRSGTGGYGGSGSNFVPGAGGLGGADGGAGGRGGDSPFFTGWADPQPGFVPGGGGGGGGAGVVVPGPPIMPTITGEYDILVPAQGPGEPANYNNESWVVVADLALLGTYQGDAQPFLMFVQWADATFNQELFGNDGFFAVHDSAGESAFGPGYPGAPYTAVVYIPDHGASFTLGGIVSSAPTDEEAGGSITFAFNGRYWAMDSYGTESNHAFISLVLTREITAWVGG